MERGMAMEKKKKKTELALEKSRTSVPLLLKY